MELQLLINLIRSKRKLLIFFAFIGFAIGGIAFLWPIKYRAEGSFVIYGEPESTTNTFFSYEGYYAQQTALSYTNSAIAILESSSLIKETLEEMQINVSSQTLHNIEKNIDVKKVGPQVFKLTVKDYQQEKAVNLWKMLSKNFVEWNHKSNQNENTKMRIKTISSEPVTRTTPKNPALYTLTGLLTGSLLGLAYIFFKEDNNNL